MKIQDPRQPHQAIAGNNVQPKKGDTGIREFAGRTMVREEASKNGDAPPGDAFEELESAPRTDVPPAFDPAREVIGLNYAGRLDELVNAAAYGVFQSGGAPDARQIVGWAVSVLEAIDAAAAQHEAEKH